MGARGPHPQPDRPNSRHKNQADNVVDLQALTGGIQVAEPAVPEDYREETKRAWRSYWSSDLVQAIIHPDVVEVEKYFRLYDRWLFMMEDAETTPFGVGSTGQKIVNPALGAAHQLQADMARLGTALGITPSARQNLKLTAGRAKLTVADVNRMTSRGSKRPTRRAQKVIEGQWEAID